MCGIAGWVGLRRDRGVLRAMTDAVRHRGPDGEGHTEISLGDDLVAALGHRRLSIIDLEAGSQPMQSHDGRFTIVFNGEIYNYLELQHELRAKGAVFRTHSDTEVILEAWRAWGKDSLSRFRGMFAFALYDAQDQSVVFARDPFGKKPLFYMPRPCGHGKEELVFGSEIAALLLHPDCQADINPSAIYNYLCWRYVPGPDTFFSGIRKLRPGAYIRWQGGRWQEQRYWIPPEETGVDRPTQREDQIGAFLDVFDEAVRLRLRSDVPLGAFLSSGLDSSSIVATLAHLDAPEIRTFSVGFKGDADTELDAAAETARYLGTIHTPIELDTDQMLALLPELSRHRGAPMAETADLPIFLMSKQAAQHVKVILSGEGADEMFAGYPKHVAEAYLGRLAPSGLLSLASRSLLAGLSVLPGDHRRLTIAAMALKERKFDQRMVRWFGALPPEERDAIWIGPDCDMHVTNPTPFSAASNASPLRRVLQFDQTSWLPDNLLERMDSMTMAASIEGRAPFMDVKLAEFATTLPEEWRIKGRVTKRILRCALEPRLPEAVLRRPKNGFRMPVSAWFRGELHDQLQDLLSSADCVLQDYVDVGKILGQLQAHKTGQADHAKTLWAIFALEIFLREFFRKEAAC